MYVDAAYLAIARSDGSSPFHVEGDSALRPPASGVHGEDHGLVLI